MEVEGCTSCCLPCSDKLCHGMVSLVGLIAIMRKMQGYLCHLHESEEVGLQGAIYNNNTLFFLSQVQRDIQVLAKRSSRGLCNIYLLHVGLLFVQNDEPVLRAAEA